MGNINIISILIFANITIHYSKTDTIIPRLPHHSATLSNACNKNNMNIQNFTYRTALVYLSDTIYPCFEDQICKIPFM